MGKTATKSPENAPQAPTAKRTAKQTPAYAFDLDAAEAFGLASSIELCGVDEVGRGPWAGPVVAASVILDPARPIAGLGDSKALSAKKRALLYGIIMQEAVAVHIAEVSVEDIDRLNILEATKLAMRRAVAGLNVRPRAALVDGNQDPKLGLPTKTVIKGDSRSPAIAAASIVAKVFRDNLMAELAKTYPHYAWERNAGYGVAAHREGLNLVGVSPFHRKSFSPIRKILSEE